MTDFDRLRQKFETPRPGPPPSGKVESRSRPEAKQPSLELTGEVSVRVGADLRVKLADLPQEVQEAVERRLTFRNPLHRALTRAGRSTDKVTRYLRGYYTQGEDLVVARGWAGSFMRLLQFHRISGRYTDQTVSAEAAEPLSFHGVLYGYQAEAVADCLKRRFGITIGPIGCGKKVAAFYLMARLRMPTLVIVQYRWQLYQWKAMADQFLTRGDELVGIVGHGRQEIDRPLVIGTDRTLYRVADQLAEKTGFMVVDRCDDIQFNVFFKLVRKIPSCRMLGLAAAPKRGDGLTQLMQAYMGPVLHTIPTDRVQAELKVTPPELVTRETRFDYDYRDDFAKMLTAASEDDQRNQLIVSDILAETADPESRAVVVCERKPHLDLLKKRLAENYRDAACISARTTKGSVERILNNFNHKTLQVICVTARSLHRIQSDRINRVIIASPIANGSHVATAVSCLLRAKKSRLQGRIVDYLDVPAQLRGTYKRRLKVYWGFNVGTRNAERGTRSAERGTRSAE